MTGMEESASGQRSLKSQGVEWVARWGADVQDTSGNQVVRFTYEGQNGSTLMDAPPGTLNPQELSDEELNGLRQNFARSCTISWRGDAGLMHRDVTVVHLGFVLVVAFAY